jgi:hypothetical protein
VITLAASVGIVVAGCAGDPRPAPAAAISAPAKATPTVGTAGANTAEVVAAARAFLQTLPNQQQDAVLYDFDDEAKAVAWSHLPTSLAHRDGIALGELDDSQRQAALAVLEAALSEQGYQQLLDVLAADDYLTGTSGGLEYGSGKYYIAFFGEPAEHSAFMLQFGGHDLAYNLTYSADTVSASPQFVGSEPTTFAMNGTSFEPMAAESSAVLAMINGLSAEQLAAAQISGSFDDLVLGAGSDGPFPTPEGQLVSALGQEQQDAVTAVIRAWVGDLDEEAAEALVARYVAEYDRTYIGWSGATTLDDENTYIRVDGPGVWIEFSNQTGLVLDEIHHQTIYRDQAADYGGS